MPSLTSTGMLHEAKPGLDCPVLDRDDFSNCSMNADHLIIGRIPTYFSIASCSLSCSGSLLIFVAYFALKGIRNVAQKIITLLALADFFTATGYLLADWNYLKYTVTRSQSCQIFSAVCEVQSFVTSWSSICSFGWTCALALHLYLLLSARKQFSLSNFLVWENLVIWIFPLLILLPLLVTSKLGYSTYATSNWCFIRTQKSVEGVVDKEEIVLILVGGKLWEMLSYTFVIVMYSVTIIKFNKRVSCYTCMQKMFQCFYKISMCMFLDST